MTPGDWVELGQDYAGYLAAHVTKGLEARLAKMQQTINLLDDLMGADMQKLNAAEARNLGLMGERDHWKANHDEQVRRKQEVSQKLSATITAFDECSDDLTKAHLRLAEAEKALEWHRGTCVALLDAFKEYEESYVCRITSETLNPGKSTPEAVSWSAGRIADQRHAAQYASIT